MEIICPPELIPFLRNKYLLLDTNVFRDAASNPVVFREFFNNLKRADVTLCVIDVVKYELLKGSANSDKYKAKEKLIYDIVDADIPLLPKTFQLVFELIKKYQIDGTALGITDLILGASLMQYRENLCLMTRDTTDFIQNVFNVPFIINVKHGKGIFTYGIYQFLQ